MPGDGWVSTRSWSARPRGAPHRHAAFGAIKATLPLDSTAYEPQRTAQDGYFIWVERIWLNKLEALRQPGEGGSETILRWVAMGAGGRPGRRGAELFGAKTRPAAERQERGGEEAFPRSSAFHAATSRYA